ncbi:TrmH family RNA methyltransferase [Butyrivibrio sp. AE2015]|uniref:TrmH family RNA methyltransferase n=1 Tax=Butyrivibrio sp. AE2015 TaxID=1280663 RepID=UPI0003B4DE32|nr:RNA methyltransferase [Butyrivibrio sp. AE2015]
MSSSFISITNLNTPDLRVYHEYSENQLFHINEPDLGIFIAESPKVIGRALDAGYEPISLLLEKDQTEKEAEEIIERITSRFDVPVYVAESEVLTQITGFHLTRGVLCAMRRKELPSVADVCQKARRVAVLENVTNPTNLGAIVRSAAALGMDAVLFTHGCTDPLYRRAARVSMGTVFQVPWTFLPEGKEFESLRELGFKSVAMALRNDTKDISDDELQSTDKLAIFLGAEGDGLLPETISACDYCVKIPMAHGVDSLNVAAASAVAFWVLSAAMITV